MKFVKASLCLSIALAVTACSEQVSVESHLANAKSYLNENKVNESIIELKNAIRGDNKNAEARFLLGRTYLNLGDGVSAVKELERAHQLDYAANKVIPLLARAYTLTDSDADVLALSDKAAKLANEEQSHYLAYKTLASLRSEEVDIAKESASLAETLSKQSLYSMLALAYLQLSENNYDEVKTLILRVLTIDAQQVDAIMLQGQVSMVTKDYDQAALSFKQYLNLQPRSGIVQLLLADAFLKSEQYEQAEKLADGILKRIPNQPFAHYIKAMVAFNGKAFDKASEHAEMALSANFNQFNLKLVAGASAFYIKNWQQSHHHLTSVVKYLPKDHQARRMLAVTQLELGLIDEISATVGDFEANQGGDAQFMTSLSYKLLELGATSEARKLLVQNESTTLKDAGENARQGILKLMMNDPSGIQNLQDAVKLDPKFIEAELALAYAALQGNDIKKAHEIATKWRQEYPEKAGGYNLIASIAIKEKKYEDAEQALEQSLTIEPDNLFALTEQLRIARQQKNEVLSKQRVDYLIALAPSNNKVLRHYFGVYRNEMALGTLQAAYQLDKSDIKKAILVAEAMVSLGQYKQADNLLISLAETPKLPKRYWQLLAFSYKKQNDNKKVKSLLESWLKASPYHIEPVVLLADLHASNGNNERALNVVQRGLDYHKDNLILQLVKMQLLLNSKQITPAKTLYKILAVSNINDALKQGFLGRIFLLEENYVQAIPKLNQLYQVYPSSQNVVYAVAAYMGNKEEAKAVKMLEHYLTINPNENRIKTMLAGLHLESDTNKAIIVYEDIVIKQPKNIIAHNNLAWLYLEQNKVDKALMHAKEAFALAPHIPNIADTYGKVLLNSGDKRGALKYANIAFDLAKGQDVDIQLNYVEALIANSRVNEAKDLLSKTTPQTDEQIKKKSELQAQL
ncbi:XrtA/PEP-CTERM system TPR-repeat protein PrsT [Colwellia psychrerythraea]|uniref:PEP-CTERM system TPR-repeat lipoprotein n=1 Tax=Colwellia psychrerythraea TaxID=28229 RepID=A0A099L2Y1_COLPS|nr:XrtA/PEP-CTERM system TPR-repeat protein PrsT [Colwellia psychrerythraea]KGJ97329.1 PEP-CTERM system TPR-repeat lipoprotein [Colwellia psychrerythraea]